MNAARAAVRHFPVEAVIFDLDGTLLDSAEQIAAAINIVFRAKGHETFSAREIADHIGWGSQKLIETTFASRGRILDRAETSSLEATYLANYAEISEARSVFYPGAIDLVHGLRAMGVRIGLCTNKPEGISRSILRKSGILECFSVLICGDSGFGLKPSPAPLHAARQRLKATAPRTLFVGDSAIDAEAARLAGVPLALIHHQGANVSSVASGACQTLKSLPELLEIVARRNSGGPV